MYLYIFFETQFDKESFEQLNWSPDSFQWVMHMKVIVNKYMTSIQVSVDLNDTQHR